MAADYTKYLAGAIITENKIVTYRLLSRALKVHVNVAKRMLYDFHHKQNAKKPGSIHATYLVTGFQVLAPPVKSEANGDGDVSMANTSFMSSSMPQVEEEAEPIKQKVITLVKEENLEAVKAKYEMISSVHVYSLEPSTIQNLQVLSAVTQRVIANYSSEDPLIHNKTYGIIQNPNVKRRIGTRPPPAPLPIKAETKSAFTKTKEPKTTDENQTLSKPKEAPPGSGEQATKIGAPALIKRESSDLFKSFAKAKPKAKKEDKKPAKPTDDVLMEDAADDNNDNDEEDEDIAPAPAKDSESRRQARLKKEESRRKLIESSDEDESMAGIKAEPKDQYSDVEPESEPEPEPENEVEEDDQPSAPLDAPKPKEEKEEDPQVTVSGGRRRGRRKVMKKKMTRDAEGYLVTKEEAVWESFSEDDVPPPAPKAKFAPASSASKGKKTTGKSGQGNLMNFFGKK